MKIVFRFALALLFSAVQLAGSESSRSAHDPARNRRQIDRDGFVEFAVKQINPDNTDYGLQIANLEEVIVARTIDNLLFWCNCGSLALLIAAFVVIIHQTKERKHRQLIAAQFLTWYHNELLEARARLHEEVGKFERSIKAVNERHVASSASEAFTLAAAPTPRSAHENELMSENHSLRQKVALMEGLEKTLRQQNAQLTRALREEQQKGRVRKHESAPASAVRKEGTNVRA